MENPYEEREDQLRQLSRKSGDCLLRGEFEVAETIARELLATAEYASEDWQSFAHLRLGTILENVGRYEEALQQAHLARSVVLQDHPNWLNAAGLIGNILLHHKNDLAGARIQYQSVLRFEADSPFALCNLAATESRQGEIELSRKYALRAIEASRKKQDREHLSVAFNLLGDAERDTGNTTQAMKHYRSALAISEEIGRRRGISIACQSLSRIECERGNYNAGLELGQRVIRVETKMGRRAEVEDACFRLSHRLKDVEEPEVVSAVIAILQTALEVAADSSAKVLALQEKAWLHKKLEQLDQAEHALTEAMKHLEQSDEQMAKTHWLMGIVNYNRQLPGAAQASFVEALELAEQYGHTRVQQISHSSLGFQSVEQDPFQACHHWQLALEIAQRDGDQEYAKKYAKKYAAYLKQYRPTMIARLRNWLR